MNLLEEKSTSARYPECNTSRGKCVHAKPPRIGSHGHRCLVPPAEGNRVCLHLLKSPNNSLLEIFRCVFSVLWINIEIATSNDNYYKARFLLFLAQFVLPGCRGVPEATLSLYLRNPGHGCPPAGSLTLPARCRRYGKGPGASSHSLTTAGVYCHGARRSFQKQSARSR